MVYFVRDEDCWWELLDRSSSVFVFRTNKNELELTWWDISNYAGESETFLQKAIQEQGRGRILDTISEIQERHDAVKDLERNLQELHQVFMDMAVLVHEQGEKLDDIESHVNRAHSFVRGGTQELSKARVYQKSTRKWTIIGIIILLIVALIIILSLRPWTWNGGNSSGSTPAPSTPTPSAPTPPATWNAAPRPASFLRCLTSSFLPKNSRSSPHTVRLYVTAHITSFCIIIFVRWRGLDVIELAGEWFFWIRHCCINPLVLRFFCVINFIFQSKLVYVSCSLSPNKVTDLSLVKRIKISYSQTKD